MERSNMIFRPRRSACSVIVRSLRDSPKKPHAAPPAGILSVWQIKENPVGNDLLIIVNGLISLPPFCRPRRRRHCADNNEARLGPRLGIAAVLRRIEGPLAHSAASR